MKLSPQVNQRTHPSPDLTSVTVAFSLFPWMKTLKTYPLSTLQAHSSALCYPRSPRCPLHPQNFLTWHKRSIIPSPAPISKLLRFCKLGCFRAHVSKSTTQLSTSVSAFFTKCSVLQVRPRYCQWEGSPFFKAELQCSIVTTQDPMGPLGRGCRPSPHPLL